MSISWIGKNRVEELKSPMNVHAKWEGDKVDKVLFCFHGFGDNAKNFSQIAQELKSNNTLFLCVQGPKPVPMGMDGYQWYPLFANPLQELRHSTTQVLQLIADVEFHFSLRSDQIYLMGFSQGASMALHCFLKKQKKMGGVLALSGFYLKLDEADPAFSEDILNTPILITHGNQDQVIFPIAFYELQNVLKQKKMKHVTANSYAMGHQITPEVTRKMESFLQENSR